MARTFRRKSSVAPISELNLTNLIDLGFTLLIIFMIAAPLINEQTIPINLPHESPSLQVAPDPATRFVAVSIDEQGNYYLQDSTTPISESALRDRLREFAGSSNPPVMRIRGHTDVSYGKIIQLIDVLKQHDLLKFTFDTQTGG